MGLTNEQSTLAVTTLQQMVDLLGIAATAEDISSGDEAVVTLRTEDAARLIGRQGQHLESLELLLNRLIHKAPGDFAFVLLDVDGYRREKRERPPRDSGFKASPELEKKALDMAKEVKRWGQPKTLGPLSPGERRAVHVVIRDFPGVETESGPDEGKGMKKLTIRPAPDKTASPRHRAGGRHAEETAR